jgi:hypothetical protein
VIAWHMLRRRGDDAFARPSLSREKIRKLGLLTSAERRKGKRNQVRIFATPAQHRLEKKVAAQAEIAYRRLSQDWQPAMKGHGCRTGTHLPVSRSDRQRGRSQPQLLRFSSRPPAPGRTRAKGAAARPAT